MSAAAPRVRTRLKPEDRVLQILEAAGTLIVEQGIFPIPLESLSQRIGVSKGLIYSYFPTQHDLANRLLGQLLAAFAEGPLQQAAKRETLEAAASECAEVYFEHVCARGPLLHILLSDPYLAERIEPQHWQSYRQIMRPLARRLRQERGLSSGESVAALNILVAIPEELGNWVYLRRLDRDLAGSICREMVEGAVSGLASVRPS